jgi:uncharacterized protein YqgC (DUF456 family)
MITDYVALGALISCLITGFVFVFFGLPGTYLLLAGALLYDLITWSWAIGSGSILFLVSLVAFGEAFNSIVGVAAARGFKSSFLGTVGAMIGTVVGGVLGIRYDFIGILSGILLGGLFGAFLLEFIRLVSVREAGVASMGAFLGRVMSIFIRFEAAMMMIVVIALSSLT